MRAVVFDDYGTPDVLRLTDRPIPQRSANEILIKVHASSVNPIDYRLRSGEMKGILPGGFPRIPGYDVAGEIIESPTKSTFDPGDRVIAFLDNKYGGALAEYAVCEPEVVARIPAGLPFEQAAAIPLAGTTALQSLRNHGNMQTGDHVLINGASGGVGAFAVQIAKAYDCHVDAVASGDNEEFCKSLGADHFYNYEDVNFEDSAERWDVVFDAAGKSGYWNSRTVLNKGGRYVSTEPDVKGMIMTVVTWPLSKSGTVMLAKPNADDLRTLIDLYEQGKLKITIDSTFPLSKAADAHRYVEQGVERGKVIVSHQE
ncbi:NAD(P)-dependent alcohol dehydrogenase [Polystyrenella longa]|nr:NAD(P)-dependent alcohol dehydrogenase [Polystyrenella longa]